MIGKIVLAAILVLALEVLLVVLSILFLNKSD